MQDLVVFSWQPGLIDRWLEEEEEVGGHPRDPHKRVEALASTRHITVALDGVVLADSAAPSSSSKPICRPAITCPVKTCISSSVTEHEPQPCPYKGEADHYWDAAGPIEAKNVAWSYTITTPRCREDRQAGSPSTTS